MVFKTNILEVIGIKYKIIVLVMILVLFKMERTFACTESIYTNLNSSSIKVLQFPDYLLEMVNNYPETKVLLDYYNEYLEDGDYHSREISISEDLLNDTVPFFLQWDKRWAFRKYGIETVMATSGCGPTSLAMVITHFTKNDKLNPKAIGDYSRKQNFYIEHVGTKWDLVSKGGKDFGLKVQPLEFNKNKIIEALDNDKVVIANVGIGHFTVGGHYIVIKAHDGKGNFLVNDPNSIENTKKIWNQDIIVKESKRIWSLGLPK